MTTKYGKCKLCGKMKSLTFEHVPPEKAFNSQAVKGFPFEESINLMTGADGRKPWDFSGLKGKINQRGGGEYFLCEECNNNTGSWYMSEYVRMVHTFHEIIQKEKLEHGNRYCYELLDLHPLRIFKAVMTMFCDINNECLGNKKIRQFLLDKESTDFPIDKYQIYMSMISPSMCRITGVSVMHLSGVGMVTVSEISRYPVGFSLYIDKPETYTPPGLLINEFAKRQYDEKANIIFQGIPYLEINSLFPDDFRSKEQIEKTLMDKN